MFPEISASTRQLIDNPEETTDHRDAAQRIHQSKITIEGARKGQNNAKGSSGRVGWRADVDRAADGGKEGWGQLGGHVRAKEKFVSPLRPRNSTQDIMVTDSDFKNRKLLG